MRHVRRPFVALLLSALLFTQSGCFGPFQAVRNLHAWNKGISDNKWVQEGVFLLLMIVPVYGIWGAGDMIIFNTIEFWTGSNPLSMSEGDHQMQDVTIDGDRYRIDVTRDRYTTTRLTGNGAGTVEDLRFDRCDNTWKFSNGIICDERVLTCMDERVRVYTPDGPMDVPTGNITDRTGLLAFIHAQGEEAALCER